MKRDLDLVRSILIYVEKAEDEVDAEDLVTDDWPFEIVAYHVRLMAHHGLVDLSDDVRDMNSETLSLAVSGLTWDGQDYLDAIRDPKVWSKVKKTVKEAVGSTTLEVVKQTGALVAMSMVKASLGM
ncbi:DUF2513 domain-containing protein [Olsenella uli]|uniref:DUF2513 domain-containing protein n=1 Tax=Olsenella uli TaxID=133926 RepID=UPI003D7AC69E